MLCWRSERGAKTRNIMPTITDGAANTDDLQYDIPRLILELDKK
jgi:hypothetical protein